MMIITCELKKAMRNILININKKGMILVVHMFGIQVKDVTRNLYHLSDKIYFHSPGILFFMQ